MELRSIGVPLDSPTWVLCDNLGVVRSVSAPDHVLKKKHLAVAYHMAREAVANSIDPYRVCSNRAQLGGCLY